VRLRLGVTTRPLYRHHRSPCRALIHYSYPEVISILTKLDSLGLSDDELESMNDKTLAEIDRLVNTIREG
jgi:hypothetical protein